MMMFHTATELLPPPSSPTISSISCSDLDTNSTGSFFYDRSTTLGTLMGVTTTFRTITFQTPSRHRDNTATISLGSTPKHRNYVRRSRRKKVTASDLVVEKLRKGVRRRNWWWLCSGEASNPSKLGEFLEVERRFGVEAVLIGGGGDALMDVKLGDHHRKYGRMLFANGRVLPPPQFADVDEGTAYSLCRFPVLLAGICSGCIR